MSRHHNLTWYAGLALAQYLFVHLMLVGFEGCSQYGFAGRSWGFVFAPLLAWPMGALIWLIAIFESVPAVLDGRLLATEHLGALALVLLALALPAALLAAWVWLRKRSARDGERRWRPWRRSAMFLLLLTVNAQWVLGFCASMGA